MHPIATLLSIWFHHLGRLVDGRAGYSHADQPAWLLLNNYLLRTRNRLLRLIAHWQAGTLRAPRLRPARPRKAPANPAPRPPRARAWMLKRAGRHAAAYASQLQHMLDQPDMQRLLAEVPRAARLLRPLAHILGLSPLPAVLILPPRPRKPRAPKPRVPRPPPLTLPANIRAAARAWKHPVSRAPPPAAPDHKRG